MGCGQASQALVSARRAASRQADGKFVYEHVEHLNNAQVKQALEPLIMAGLVIPVTHSSANGIPLGAGIRASLENFGTVSVYIDGANANVDIYPIYAISNIIRNP